MMTGPTGVGFILLVSVVLIRDAMDNNPNIYIFDIFQNQRAGSTLGALIRDG
jgi:hypothetical protein